jgi:hypothetical protein
VEIQGCDSALYLVQNPTKIKVEKIEGVNSAIQDYSPKPTKNGLIFSSQKTDTAVNITANKFDHYSSIFTADKAGKSYANKTLLPTPPNDEKRHTGNAILTADGNTIIYTSCGQNELLGNRLRLQTDEKH